MTARLKIFAFLVLFGICNQSISQIKAHGGFQTQYDRAEELIGQTCDSLKLLLERMNTSEQLTEIQRAKLDLLRSKFQILDDIFALTANYKVLPFDTIANPGSLIERAQNFIIQSRPDEGIPLLLRFIKNTDSQSDSAIYAKIYLAEAYRQKQEYNKGISMVYEILSRNYISIQNKAFAMNRLAALYNEMPAMNGSNQDSVVKYSRLCIEISEKNKLKDYLAASQNELGRIYLGRGLPDSALILISAASNNFLLLNKYPQAINTYINLSYVYSSMGDLEASKEILIKALELGSIEENRNLFMYVYYLLAEKSFIKEDYHLAYEYLHVAYSLLNQFFNDRIQLQINEMSAKYELQEKEDKIREEEHKSKAYRLRMNYLVVIALISICMFMILVFLFRFKSSAYDKLVEQNLKSMVLEKQVEDCLVRLSMDDLHTKTGTDDQHTELALRLEKFLAEEKPYLWSDANLDEFCKKLNTNRTYLSKLIKDKYNLNFYDLLSKYRIRAAIQYLNDPQYKHLSVEGIGGLTGFKSNSNFHKRFKDSVGMTPNEFRERALKMESRSAI
jgi:AraC-like DNA-binding protein